MRVEAGTQNLCPRGSYHDLRVWIPACAGMTVLAPPFGPRNALPLVIPAKAGIQNL